MEKTRVNKGYKYWYLDEYLHAIDTYEENSKLDDKLWEIGNYHNSEEEALEVAKLIWAVFNGADVIEMPSEEEISKRPAQTNPFDTSEHEGTLAGYTNGAHSGYFKGYADCLNWLNSKIMK